MAAILDMVEDADEIIEAVRDSARLVMQPTHARLRSAAGGTFGNV